MSNCQVNDELFQQLRELNRKMEIMGHEVEVQAAIKIYGVDKDKYRRDEAIGMVSGYRNLFKDYTADEIVAEMSKKEDKVRRWVEKYMKYILKQK